MRFFGEPSRVSGRVEALLHTRSLTRLGSPKGDASESVWLELLNKYLPERYRAATAHVVDSEGEFSDQIDVVIFDRQYSPFIFRYEGQIIVPAESVYAVFEAKQTTNADQVTYAQNKVAVERLYVKLHVRKTMKLVNLRMCTAVGPSYHKDGGVVSILAKMPIGLLLDGKDTEIQFIHEFDLCRLVEKVVPLSLTPVTFMRKCCKLGCTA